MEVSPSVQARSRRPPVLRAGLMLLLVLPLWALWFYAFVSLRDFRDGIDRLPGFYGIHLCRQGLENRLAQFSRVVARLDRETGKTAPEWLGVPSALEEINETAGLFGLEQPLLLVRHEGLEILYPPSPQGPLAGILEDPGAKKALMHVLGRMTAGGMKEAFCSLGSEDPPAGVAARWYLVSASRGDGFLWVLMTPEHTVDLAGKHLQAAQLALVEQGVDRFVAESLPAVILATLLICLACRHLSSPGKECTEERFDGDNGAETRSPAGP